MAPRRQSTDALILQFRHLWTTENAIRTTVDSLSSVSTEFTHPSFLSFSYNAVITIYMCY